MQRQPLDRIQVNGFKSIRELDLPLGKLNVLIGPNGAGKSNFVGLFRLLNSIVERRLGLYTGQNGGAENLLHFGTKSTEYIGVSLHFGTNAYTCRLMPTQDDSLVFGLEECLYRPPLSKHPRPFTESLGSGHGESRLSREPGRPVVAHVLESLESWIVYHFHDTSDSARVRKACDMADNRRLRPDASNLAAYLYMLRAQHPGYYQNIVDAIGLTAPFFDGFVLEPDRLKPDSIRLEWRHKESDRYFGPQALSDGTLRFVCLATLLMQPVLPTTVLLDEPELGLHPQAIGLLAEMLKSAATRTQLVVATQSVTLVNHFDPDVIVVVEQRQGRSVFRRLAPEEIANWIDDYGMGDLWEKNVFGGRP
jgi:predicted ATPase